MIGQLELCDGAKTGLKRQRVAGRKMTGWANLEAGVVLAPGVDRGLAGQWICRLASDRNSNAHA